MAVQYQDKELDKMYLIGTGVPNFQTTPSHDTGDDPCKFWALQVDHNPNPFEFCYAFVGFVAIQEPSSKLCARITHWRPSPHRWPWRHGSNGCSKAPAIEHEHRHRGTRHGGLEGDNVKSREEVVESTMDIMLWYNIVKYSMLDHIISYHIIVQYIYMCVFVPLPGLSLDVRFKRTCIHIQLYICLCQCVNAKTNIRIVCII